MGKGDRRYAAVDEVRETAGARTECEVTARQTTWYLVVSALRRANFLRCISEVGCQENHPPDNYGFKFFEYQLFFIINSLYNLPLMGNEVSLR